MRHTRPQRGLTLLETLVAIFCTGLLAALTFSAVGQARLAQARSKDRARMLTIALTELDRIRTVKVAQRTEGTMETTNAEWPKGLTVASSLAPRADGTWSAEVVVAYDSIEGREPVRLATILPGERP